VYLLASHAPLESVLCALECHTERALPAVPIAHEHHLVPAVLFHQPAQRLVVEQRGILHRCRIELPEGGRARDVGEHDRHLALWRTSSATGCRAAFVVRPLGRVIA
jgi:hypothetical protein